MRFAGEILHRADEIHIHDDWTRKKFDEYKYKSRDIYSRLADSELRKEYQDCLKRLLGEERKQ